MFVRGIFFEAVPADGCEFSQNGKVVAADKGTKTKYMRIERPTPSPARAGRSQVSVESLFSPLANYIIPTHFRDCVVTVVLKCEAHWKMKEI